jgi:hypothetical protein
MAQLAISSDPWNWQEPISEYSDFGVSALSQGTGKHRGVRAHYDNDSSH